VVERFSGEVLPSLRVSAKRRTSESLRELAPADVPDELNVSPCVGLGRKSLRDPVLSRVVFDPTDGVCVDEMPGERDATDRRRSVRRCITESRADVLSCVRFHEERPSSCCLPMRLPMLLLGVRVRDVSGVVLRGRAGVRPVPGVRVLGVLGVRLDGNDRLRSRIERRVVLFDGDEMLGREPMLDRVEVLGRVGVVGRVIVMRL
jgi:hypothetical protein